MTKAIGLGATSSESIARYSVEGASLTQIAACVLGSLEGYCIAVHDLYGNLLHRPADAAGLQLFVSNLPAGTSLDQIASAIRASDEYFGLNSKTSNSYRSRPPRAKTSPNRWCPTGCERRLMVLQGAVLAQVVIFAVEEDDGAFPGIVIAAGGLFAGISRGGSEEKRYMYRFGFLFSSRASDHWKERKTRSAKDLQCNRADRI